MELLPLQAFESIDSVITKHCRLTASINFPQFWRIKSHDLSTQRLAYDTDVTLGFINGHLFIESPSGREGIFFYSLYNKTQMPFMMAPFHDLLLKVSLRNPITLSANISNCGFWKTHISRALCWDPPSIQSNGSHESFCLYLSPWWLL